MSEITLVGFFSYSFYHSSEDSESIVQKARARFFTKRAMKEHRSCCWDQLLWKVRLESIKSSCTLFIKGFKESFTYTVFRDFAHMLRYSSSTKNTNFCQMCDFDGINMITNVIVKTLPAAICTALWALWSAHPTPLKVFRDCSFNL